MVQVQAELEGAYESMLDTEHKRSTQNHEEETDMIEKQHELVKIIQEIDDQVGRPRILWLCLSVFVPVAVILTLISVPLVL